MKTRKQERKKTVLVWVTNPDACQSIVSAGRKLADDNKVELVIVSIQGSIKGDWNNRASDLKKLSEAAKVRMPNLQLYTQMTCMRQRTIL